MRRLACILPVLLAALLVPANAAHAADQPDVVDDPPAAFCDATSATVDLDDVPIEAAAAAPRPRPTAVHAPNVAPAPRGELPFTGPNTDVFAPLLLALLLISAGSALRALPSRSDAGV
jgi:hypothetical protein